MSWSFGGPSLSGITSILSSPECTLEDVLLDSTLPQAIRNSIEPLVNFITRDEILTEIINWALTNKNKDHEKCAKLTRSAVTLLTSSSQLIQRKIQGNQIFTDRLVGFQDTPEAKDPRIGGHYQRIVEQVVRFTGGNFLKNLPNLPDFLIDGMSILGLRELFVLLSTEFTQQFSLNIDIVRKLSEKAKSEIGYFVATAIKSILKQKSQDVIQFFQDVGVVRNLLDAASSPCRPLVATELYQTISLIVEKCQNREEIDPLIKEYAQKYLETNQAIDCSTASATMLFKSINQTIFSHIFDVPVNTFLNQSIIAVVRQMPNDERFKLFKDTNTPEKLKDSFEKTKANGQLTELVPLLQGFEPLPQDWSVFKETVEGVVKIQNSSYGGKVPNSSSDDSDDDSDDGVPYQGNSLESDSEEEDSSDSNSGEESGDEEEDSDDEEEEDKTDNKEKDEQKQSENKGNEDNDQKKTENDEQKITENDDKVEAEKNDEESKHTEETTATETEQQIPEVKAEEASQETPKE